MYSEYGRILKEHYYNHTKMKFKAWINNVSTPHLYEEWRRYDGEKVIITNITNNEYFLLYDDGSCGKSERSELKEKTGRMFPELANIIKKMKDDHVDIEDTVK